MRSRTLLFGSFCLLLAVSAAFAGEPPVPIEGKLWVSGHEFQDGWYAYAYYLQGTSDQATAWPGEIEHADISPVGDALAYQVTAGLPWTTTGDIWVCSLDGSANANISQAAGLSGLNCFPCWSPDASRIAFRHVDPVDGQRPCETGFQVWVMNADGTNAHRVSPQGLASVKLGGWSPDGHSVVCALYGVAGAITMNVDGSNVTSLSNVRGEGADFSPNGRQIAGTWAQEDTVDGQPGVWRELRVADLHGGDPQTLVSQFIAHSDAEAMVDRLGLDPLAADWVADIEWRVGPLFPQWSPKGDRIAFLAALPFDPDGADYREQVDVWIYTLSNGDLTRITNNELKRDTWLSWHGNNTYPDYPSVTVNNTTVTFDQVLQEGLTTILLVDDPPGVLSDQLTYDCYDINTTAETAGDIHICMTYRDDEAPVGTPEAELAILLYNKSTSEWDDITVSRDPVSNKVCAVTSTLSLFTLHGIRRPRFTDVPSWGYGDGGLDPHWAFWEIEACADAGIVSGYGDGTYQPGNPVTRDQMAVYISRALAGGDWYVPDFTGTPKFSDVPEGDWALDYVQYAVQSNVVQGYGDGTYHPQEQVNRAQMAVYVARALVAPSGEAGLADYVPADPRNFPDVPDTGYGDDGTEPYWAYAHIEYCVEHAVVQGYLDGYYHPDEVVTRAQMAVYVARAFELTG